MMTRESYQKYREYLERVLKRDDLTKEQRRIAAFGLTRKYEDYVEKDKP